MAKLSSRKSATPHFVGQREQLQTLANWLDDLVGAAYCPATDGDRSEEYLVDVGTLNKVLAVGNEALGCLNIVDAQKCSRSMRELQRDAAVILAGGLDGMLVPSAEEQQAAAQLQRKLREAMPYFHSLGVRVRAKLAEELRPVTSEPQTPPGDGQVPKVPAKRGGGGRTKDPKVQARNRKVKADLGKLDNDAIAEKYQISADLARRLRCELGKAHRTAKNRQS